MVIVLSSPQSQITLSKVRKIRLEYTSADSIFASQGRAAKAHVTGEAAFAVLPDGRLFLALLKGLTRKGDEGFNALVAGSANFRPWQYEGMVEDWKGVPASKVFDLESEVWPAMVTGEIIDGNLENVSRVDPENPIVPGTSFRVTSVELQKTDDSIAAFELARLLPCLSEGRGCSTFILNPNYVGTGLLNSHIVDGFPRSESDKLPWWKQVTE
ncbi:hypothetical protein JQT66_15075 [Sulfitobacter mediterraneus]|uniref:hypothetical protein n=1 Tax=Sulfitobacter mediterraneus TaxID=83219 RepID=UPI0019342F94|nr:hypothetical protein [Sulfitobacter mediterraneus]MBM1311561.1 hypothetical protein [Sulfitobacter mediterraneus]MBM1315443.1 hypothetical protein [Sulfitobacter mediterraneus]MBM1323804.1 hypothetical protein [Sulfitobacter mediterraneus]MBM1327716.1 hypothetical protein [Sulfitobacter mediterraneus]MBM1399064.1 hypothetical protein [Sulfitobacter mediterraneus]